MILAIAYDVQSSELHILGKTTFFGNVALENATRNTQFVLHMLQEDIPVYKGSKGPLSGKELNLKVAQRVHGIDGLVSCLEKHQNQFECTNKNEKDAVSFIIDSIKQHPNKITLLFVVPLTNLAKVIQKSPEVIEMVKEVVVMGRAVTVPGNVKSYAEPNIYSDPDAAQMLFQSGLPIKLVGFEMSQWKHYFQGNM